MSTTTTKKRPHDDPPPHPIQTPPPQPQPQSSTSTSPPPPSSSTTTTTTAPSSADNLLTPLPPHDWTSLTSRLTTTLQSSLDETSRLTREYEMWTWLYEVWSTSHNEEETQRLGREMATLVRWAVIKEGELERAREEHRESMLAISGVLGIVPRGVGGL